ncbi:hypothetical protein PL321_11905 [Caloramator sp. mosi_1]|uniref:hypothetical protein n=1 Tax=Caloramator sp. mosi_1 TaxID=3023090 RepID=UPI0023606467|nr:hypothetical protein [Caloramator sp. mosi_1]WDC83437.1 hypothetical protein PL321_11905 [Caloramator sp. mosi_1]
MLNYLNNLIIYKETHINLYNKKPIFKAESSPSFHGDGVDYYVYKLKKADIDLIVNDKIKDSKWNILPIDKEIYSVIDKQITYDAELTNLLKNTGYCPIPNVKNGYYFL